jgi:hypothetical protein
MAARQAEAEGLLGDLHFDRAKALADELVKEVHPRLNHLTEWAGTFLKHVEETRAQQNQHAHDLFVEAQKHEAACDYQAAIISLEAVPHALRGSTLPGFQETVTKALHRIGGKQRDAERLEAEIKNRLDAKELDGLLSSVEALLVLKPDRKDLLKIRTQLTERIERQVRARTEAVSLANGRLTIGPHQANVWDGQIKGSLVVDANTQSISVAETVSNINIESLLTGLSATDSLSGRGNLTANVSAKGASRQTMLSSLTGQVGLQLKDGAVKGVDLQAIMRAARAALGKASTQADTTDGQTRFTEITATATLKNGVANNQDLSVKAPLFRVQGSGTVDIAAGQLNYLARVTMVDTADEQGGADLKALRGVTVPVRLTGLISKPTYRVDIAALAAELAKTKFNDQVQDRINKAVPGLGDALKVLFG